MAGAWHGTAWHGMGTACYEYVRIGLYGSLLRGLGLTSVIIIEGPDYRVAAGSPTVLVRDWFHAFVRTFGARWK
jgi:hypothetical protein